MHRSSRPITDGSQAPRAAQRPKAPTIASRGSGEFSGQPNGCAHFTADQPRRPWPFWHLQQQPFRLGSARSVTARPLTGESPSHSRSTNQRRRRRHRWRPRHLSFTRAGRGSRGPDLVAAVATNHECCRPPRWAPRERIHAGSARAAGSAGGGRLHTQRQASGHQGAAPEFRALQGAARAARDARQERKRGSRRAAGSGGMQQPDHSSAGGVRLLPFCGSGSGADIG